MNTRGVPVRPEFDVVVVGLGPAGRALAHRCVGAGLRVAAVDPQPRTPWAATYGAWADELPGWLPRHVIAALVEHPAVHTGAALRRIDRAYTVLDNARLHAALDVAGARVITARAHRLTRFSAVLDDGTVLAARTVVDARGLRRGPARPEQTAYGVVVDRARAHRLLDGERALFMDWRPDYAARAAATSGEPGSFLYAVPVGDGRVLLEETCLTGLPPLAISVLRARLEARLAAHGLRLTGREPVERVRFAMSTGPLFPESPGGPVLFGSAGGLMHPATGYSVAASLSAADGVVDALARGRDPSRALWPWSARTVRHLREIGLTALSILEPAQTAGFFDAFFALPAARQRAYLSGRTDVTGTAAAMWSLFRAVDPGTRRALARAGVRRGRS